MTCIMAALNIMPTNLFPYLPESRYVGRIHGGGPNRLFERPGAGGRCPFQISEGSAREKAVIFLSIYFCHASFHPSCR